MTQLWVVRAGKGARYVEDFFSGSYIAVDFRVLAADDLSVVTDTALKSRATDQRLKVFANQLGNFAYTMAIGDMVLVPRSPSKEGDFLVGEITGPYRHVDPAPPPGPHQRDVSWIGRLDRGALSQEARNTLGAILTLFRPAAVEAELRSLLTHLAPIEPLRPPAPHPQVAPGTPGPGPAHAPAPLGLPPRRLPPVQLDVDVDSSGRARIVCAHPALVMEQVPRHIDPGTGWAGVPGVYVLTGTELQHAAVRTGVERTLTTTLIVKPWAYVGLSEDFLSRLSSHRQNKQEWRRALLVRSGGSQTFGSDDIKYLEQRIHQVLVETDEVLLAQSNPRGNLSAHPRNPTLLDACADTVVAVLRLTGTLI